MAACTKRPLPPRSRIIDRVDIVGNDKVKGRDIEKKIATTETSRLLAGLLKKLPVIGLADTLTVDYHTFDRFVLQRDLDRVKRFYRARGFYEAQVRAGRVIDTEEGHLRIEIVVDEGEPVVIESVDYTFPDQAQAFKANDAVYDIISSYRDMRGPKSEAGQRFDEDRYNEVKKKLQRALNDNGFAYGEVSGRAKVDLLRHRATISFGLLAGPACTFGDVKLVGLGEIGQRPVLEAIGIDKGDPFSSAELKHAQYALADMQVFGSVELVVLRSKPGEKRRTQIDVEVRLQPIKLRAVKLGVGLEIGTQLEAHVLVGWEDSNLLGGLRRLSADARFGVVGFPTQASTLFSQLPTDPLFETELSLAFTQPAFPEARTNTKLHASGHIYAPQAHSAPDPVPDDYNIIGYRELNGSFGLDRKFRGVLLKAFAVYVGQFFKLQFDDPFSYNQDGPPPGYERVLIPYLETLASWDFREGKDGKPNPVRPHRGLFLSTNLQFAGGFMQGDADDVRLRPEIRLYVPVSGDVVFALRWLTGFLFPRNYGDTLMQDDADPVARARDLQLLGFRAFYSGGPYSNRGYGFQEVGPHAVLPYLSQKGQSNELLPVGGLGLWELSAELRIPLHEKVNAVLFVDTSDVVASLSRYRLTHPHVSPGLGVRLFTPVGPLRFDVGVRVPYLQHLGHAWLSPAEGGPPEGETDDMPLSWSLAIGEAF